MMWSFNRWRQASLTRCGPVIGLVVPVEHPDGVPVRNSLEYLRPVRMMFAPTVSSVVEKPSMH